MTDSVLVSVIVSTYNRPDALAAVLAGLSAQSDCGFEVIVADDGSRDETRERVESVQADLAVPLMHVWHADTGFRLAAIRNRAALAASGEYLVFIDGDCVPRPDFVAQHRGLAECGWAVAGNRVLLSEDFTQRALANELPIHAWSLAQWRQAKSQGGINRTLPLLRFPLGPLRRWRPRRWQRLRGCNIGVWRTDFERVNGFDESFEGWGFEDSDFAVRLINAGVSIKLGSFATGLLHLWHRETKKPQSGPNWDTVMRRLADGETRAQPGLDRPDRD
ncbi:MAG: glycosyltransferase family 2 protein [Burkholderiaceae bacterium]